jgi:LPS sulfotransferase NodH
MNTTRFMLLMPWGRVGSNLLISILRQSAPMKLANENLNGLRTAEEQAAWFREFYEESAVQPSRAFIGSKQAMMAIRDVPAMTAMLRRADVRVVRLRRDNLVKAAVSQMRAEAHAEKLRRETGEGPWAIKKGMALPGPSILDVDLLLKRIGIMEQKHLALMAAFAPEDVLDIEYEEINTTLDGVIRRVRDYLDMPQKPYDVPFIKATPDRLEDAVANYDIVRTRLNATPYACFL